MSTWFAEAVTCPSCHVDQSAKLARGVHASRAPEVREQLFARTFHRITCRACAVRFVAKRPLVYTDIDRRHWLQVALADERPRWPEFEPATVEIFEGAFVGSPLAAGLRDGFKVRLVFGVEELREKLVIWAAGFDDAVIECAKLRLFTAEPGLASSHRLLVDSLDDASAALLAFDANDQPVRTVHIPIAAIDAAHDDEARLRRYLPELFGGGFVSWHRLLGHRYRAAARS